MEDKIYYADNECIPAITNKDYLEPHKVKCRFCHNVFLTVLPIGNIDQGDVNCPKCGCNRLITLDYPYTYDSLLYAMEAKQKIDMEDKNMKRTEKEEQKHENITITRRCDTSRGVFTVEQLEPTDLFVCVGDEKQTVYMAVKDPNNEPKYKTKKPVVNMETGELWYLDNSTKIHVYKAGGCELRVGEFIWSSEGYN